LFGAVRYKYCVPAESQLDLRRERAARNESAFRDLNERTNNLDDHGTFDVFACECEDKGCAEPVRFDRLWQARSLVAYRNRGGMLEIVPVIGPLAALLLVVGAAALRSDEPERAHGVASFASPPRVAPGV
jgi:hypothetical protein